MWSWSQPYSSPSLSLSQTPSALRITSTASQQHRVPIPIHYTMRPNESHAAAQASHSCIKKYTVELVLAFSSSMLTSRTAICECERAEPPDSDKRRHVYAEIVSTYGVFGLGTRCSDYQPLITRLPLRLRTSIQRGLF